MNVTFFLLNEEITIPCARWMFSSRRRGGGRGEVLYSFLCRQKTESRGDSAPSTGCKEPCFCGRLREILSTSGITCEDEQLSLLSVGLAAVLPLEEEEEGVAPRVPRRRRGQRVKGRMDELTILP